MKKSGGYPICGMIYILLISVSMYQYYNVYNPERENRVLGPSIWDGSGSHIGLGLISGTHNGHTY